MFQKLIPHLIKDLFKKILQLWDTPFFVLVWLFLLFFISFLVVFQFFFFIMFFFIYCFMLMFKYFISFFKKNSEQFISYKYNNFNIINNYILFLKFIFIDLSKKWSFFYFYQFVQIFKLCFNLKNKKNTLFNNFNIEFFMVQIFNLLKNYIIKYIFYLLTNFTYMVLNISLEVTIKIQQFWHLNWSSYSVFFDNLLFDIVSTYNENINNLIFKKKIIIKYDNILLNPKDKFIMIGKENINRSLNNFKDVWKYSCNLTNISYVDIKEPHILLSSTSNLSRTMVRFSGSMADRENQIFTGLKYGNKKTIVTAFIDKTRFELNKNNDNVGFTYSRDLYKNSIKSMDYKNRFVYKFNEVFNSEKNQNIISPCIEIDNKDIKLTNINSGIKGLLSPQDETVIPERIMLAKNIVLNFNEPLYKIIIENEQGCKKYFIQIDDENDTLKNRFISSKKMFSITTESIFEDLNNFIEINPTIYNDPELYNVFKHSFNFYIVQESKSGSIINILDLVQKSDSDGGNINIDNIV